MLRPKANNLLESLTTAIKDFSQEKLIQLSIDGQSTNWSVPDKRSLQHEGYELPPLENIGICELHMLHGTFKTVFQATDWSLDKILKTMWKLFHDSPTRSKTYIRLLQSELFPRKFCPTRWTENQEVVTRATEIWENLQRTIKEFSSLPNSKRPQCKSYDTLLLYVSDPLIKVKFHFFKDLASHLEVFLRKYQTDDPMMPFLSNELETILGCLMKMFLKDNILEEAVTPFKLVKVDVNKTENQCLID